ncbi:phosphoribosyltransferase family protein [Thalassotalea ponticola]|uniref:ComF family protein n=1 Tax=Thalassotalea ponticola TaxID=1523392 RepID=UPI0025B2B0A9|nr:phosphoribosyltransferase family protein [Thalassotalea ponticola]MDN3652297.1 phosphoribosyltransferase family protein [Thalassotalea ponticola]
MTLLAQISPLATRITAWCKAHLNSWLCQQSACDLCHQSCDAIPLLCTTCQRSLPGFDLSLCSANLLNVAVIQRHLNARYIDQLLVLSPHLPPVSKWITELKYQRRVQLVPLLAYLLQQQLHTVQFGADLLVPVPLAFARLRWRQFNQSSLLAQALSKYMQIEVNDQLIKRRQRLSLDQQVGKTGAERRRALAKVFYLHGTKQQIAIAVKGKHIAIVDDVVTTGTTANAIARLLKQQGASKVSVIALSLAPIKGVFNTDPSYR